jgi:predicted alpha/beta hydrolase family esterase
MADGHTCSCCLIKQVPLAHNYYSAGVTALPLVRSPADVEASLNPVSQIDQKLQRSKARRNRIELNVYVASRNDPWTPREQQPNVSNRSRLVAVVHSARAPFLGVHMWSAQQVKTFKTRYGR